MPRFDRHHDARATCPACTAKGLEHFYQVDGVPTSSNLLMSTREEAVNWPRGDLRLAYCGACGLITNTAFDPSTQQLTARYEATQACSPTFGKFARELAQDWIERYSLRGKRLLEIGCGQGEFITMLCETASATSWGFDPIVNPSRAKALGVELIAEKYGPKWWHLAPDFVVCRHTLEHILDVAVFISDVVHGIGSKPDSVLAIEVPDNQRVLNDAAFWDIYYEHCSYFDTNALLNALRFAGLEILKRRLEFGGQYLVVESRPGLPGGVTTPAATDLERFASDCAASLTRWKTSLADSPGCTVLWGSGSKAVGFLTTLGIEREVSAVVDINPAKHGTFLPGSGHEIIAPERLRQIQPRRVIVMNPVYVEEIRQSLADLGLSPSIIALT